MKEKFLLFALFFIHSISFAQLNYGKITAPKASRSFDKKTCIACDEKRGVGNIYKSENELEIRVDLIDSNNVRKLYVLSYDSAKSWACILVVDTISEIKDHKMLMKNASIKYSLKPDISFDTVFNILKENKIFRLKTEPGSVFHDTYVVLFKAGKKYCFYLMPYVNLGVKENGYAVYDFNILSFFKNHFKVNN